MYYILNLPASGPDGRLVAEIVDEAFAFPPRRAVITEIGELAGLIRGYAGIAPDRALLRELSALLETRRDALLAHAGTLTAAPVSSPLRRTA